MGVILLGGGYGFFWRGVALRAPEWLAASETVLLTVAAVGPRPAEAEPPE